MTFGKGAKPDRALADATRSLWRFLRERARVMVLTGAGVSVPSGIPCYRDADGEWKRGQPIQHARFMHDQSVRRRYWARSYLGWPRFAAARPNEAHRALAQLEQAGRIHCLVTQNVDGLHQQAGHRRVTDLHGRLDLVDCQQCGARLDRQAWQETLTAANPGFRAVAENLAPDGDALPEGGYGDTFTVPGCPQCGGVLKPNVVFFGGNIPPPRMDSALARLGRADALLVIGSSLMVFSGYRFVRQARSMQIPVAALTLGRTRADPELALRINAPCEKVLPGLAAFLASGNEPGRH